MKLQAVLDDVDKEIIALLCEGMAPKEVAHKMWKKKPYIHSRLTSLRKHYRCKTTIELVAHLIKERDSSQVL